MKTFVNTKQNKKEKAWHLLDAKEYVLGRLATKATSLLMGKHNPQFSANLLNGDSVVVINADKIKFTGKKTDQKKYRRHSGFAGGFKEHNLAYHLKKDSRFVIQKAVLGMLPKNKLRDKVIKNLYIYKDENHPHKGQVS